MKFLFDYFPIICFFIGYKLFGIFIATGITMAASFVQIALYWLRHRRFENLHLITFGFIIVLGGSTLIFHNDIFIKWKPSIIYWAFSIALLVSQWISHSPLLQRMLGDKINLTKTIWKRVNTMWAIFFLLLGMLNIYVVYHYNTNTWVNFKLFGTLGITLIFIILQAFYMAHHMQPEKKLGSFAEQSFKSRKQ